jgi:ABC-type polysaccharide transport system permease subunit
MGPNLTSKRWIVAKGILFAMLALLAGGQIVLLDLAKWQRGVMLVICVWAACRFYYFLFHVLHAYVDPSLPSAGIMDLAKHLLAKRRRL